MVAASESMKMSRRSRSFVRVTVTRENEFHREKTTISSESPLDSRRAIRPVAWL